MAAGLLTAEQVAARLGVDKSTVYRMAGDGRLPAVKVGRQWRFPEADIGRILQLAEPAAAPERVPRVDPAVAEPVLEIVAESLGIMMIVTDIDGCPLTEVANPCRWFREHASDPGTIAECVGEWRRLAGDPDFQPRFQAGSLGFECARAFIRSGPALIGMVLAGGLAPPGSATPGLYELEGDARRRVLETLPRIAAAFSRLAGHGEDDVSDPDPTWLAPPQGALR